MGEHQQLNRITSGLNAWISISWSHHEKNMFTRQCDLFNPKKVAISLSKIGCPIEVSLPYVSHRLVFIIFSYKWKYNNGIAMVFQWLPWQSQLPFGMLSMSINDYQEYRWLSIIMAIWWQLPSFTIDTTTIVSHHFSIGFASQANPRDPGSLVHAKTRSWTHLYTHTDRQSYIYNNIYII